MLTGEIIPPVFGPNASPPSFSPSEWRVACREQFGGVDINTVVIPISHDFSGNPNSTSQGIIRVYVHLVGGLSSPDIFLPYITGYYYQDMPLPPEEP
jgi:hypothetical protein